MILNFHIVWTVLLFIIFVGIIYWAFSKSSVDRFKAAEQLPFDDEQQAENPAKTQSVKEQKVENTHE
ncbi:hypothetical protein MNBD_GAMMA12-3055 [hydrothermal vent metagenome]|uniref:Cytochrome c oxidase subunit CcoQ n=1 Tax=hydrothermal vent metagenome TaxID=652676 RepID=A0A3B0Y5H7_9ZZZZ